MDMFKSGEKGLTLIEVMVGMIVMTIGLLGVAPLIVLSIEANSISKDLTIASNIARDKIEYLEALDSIPSSLFNNYEADVVITVTASDGTVLESNTYTGYNRTTLIEDNVADSLVPVGLLKVNIGVDWVDKVGMSRQTAITTYIQDK